MNERITRANNKKIVIDGISPITKKTDTQKTNSPQLGTAEKAITPKLKNQIQEQKTPTEIQDKKNIDLKRERNNQLEKMEKIDQKLFGLLDHIPIFSGDKNSMQNEEDLNHFSNMAIDISNSIEDNQQKNFLRLLKNRLKGSASQLLTTLNYDTLNELINKLHHHYIKKQSVIELTEQFRTMKQERGETILNFSERIGRLLVKVQEALNKEYPGVYTNAKNLYIEQAKRAFKAGLNNKEIKNALWLKKDMEFSKLVEDAMELDDSYKLNDFSEQNNPCNKFSHAGNYSENNAMISEFTKMFKEFMAANKTTKEKNFCSYCKIPGHNYDECKRRRRFCNKCRKNGHTDAYCRQSNIQNDQNKGNRVFPNNNNNNNYNNNNNNNNNNRFRNQNRNNNFRGNNYNNNANNNTYNNNYNNRNNDNNNNNNNYTVCCIDEVAYEGKPCVNQAENLNSLRAICQEPHQQVENPQI